MAQSPDNLNAATDAEAEPTLDAMAQETSAPAGPQAWTQNWQMPVLILGLTLLVVGTWLSLPRPAHDDFAGKLDGIEQYLIAQNLDAAEAQLQQLAPHITRASKLEQARFHLLAGDRIVLFQQLKGWNNPEAHELAINRYQQALELGQAFDTEHRKRWALTLVALGRDGEALTQLDAMDVAAVDARCQVVRQMLERRLQHPATTPADVAPLLDRYFELARQDPDPKRQRDARRWGVQLRVDLLLDANEPQQAIDFLQPQYARFTDQSGDRDLAPLMVSFARAYALLQRYREADRWYRLAQDRLNPDDPLNGRILVGLAQIALAETGDVRQALDFYSNAETRYPATDSYFDALLGHADCEARLGSHLQAIDYLGRCVQELLQSPRRSAARQDALVNVVRANYEITFGQDNYELALSYLSTLMPLYGRALPTSVLADLGMTHQKIAGSHEQQARELSSHKPTDREAGKQAVEAVRLHFKDAVIHYGKAADYFRAHAERVTVTDNAAHGESLWSAANLYEKAQLWPDAIAAFADFVRGRPDDPRYLMAKQHLGLAYLADQQIEPARALFEELINNNAKSAAAHLSHVPYARCFLIQGEYDRAQQVLEYVVTDHPGITPESVTYRDALIELGKLYCQREQYERGIEKLEEAIDEKRYGDSDQGPTLRARLADAYRQSAETLNSALKDPMPQTRRVALEQERNRRLERAKVLYTQVISALESRPFDLLTPLEVTFYRNAFFYRADCAYDMGHWEQARSLYDLAAKRWEDHPASLVALVQIVNAYCEEGAIREARVANDRARFQLKRIPDEAFNDPSLPMNRQHWEDWLRWTSELKLFGEPGG